MSAVDLKKDVLVVKPVEPFPPLTSSVPQNLEWIYPKLSSFIQKIREDPSFHSLNSHVSIAKTSHEISLLVSKKHSSSRQNPVMLADVLCLGPAVLVTQLENMESTAAVLLWNDVWHMTPVSVSHCILGILSYPCVSGYKNVAFDRLQEYVKKVVVEAKQSSVDKEVILKCVDSLWKSVLRSANHKKKAAKFSHIKTMVRDLCQEFQQAHHVEAIWFAVAETTHATNDRSNVLQRFRSVVSDLSSLHPMFCELIAPHMPVLVDLYANLHDWHVDVRNIVTVNPKAFQHSFSTVATVAFYSYVDSYSSAKFSVNAPVGFELFQGVVFDVRESFQSMMQTPHTCLGFVICDSIFRDSYRSKDSTLLLNPSVRDALSMLYECHLRLQVKDEEFTSFISRRTRDTENYFVLIFCAVLISSKMGPYYHPAISFVREQLSPDRIALLRLQSKNQHNAFLSACLVLIERYPIPEDLASRAESQAIRCTVDEFLKDCTDLYWDNDDSSADEDDTGKVIV
eukprot:ANDGO_00659.mRNA.1 hypothetical protein